MTAVSSMRLLVVLISAPRNFLALLAGDEQSRPTAGPRIAAAGPVGEYFHLTHRPRLIHRPTLLVGSAAPAPEHAAALGVSASPE